MLMNPIHLVGLLAVAQYLCFGFCVAMARGRYGVKAPATTGDERFERYYRVQMNTLELLAAFLPSLWIAAQYWNPLWMAAIGAVYLIGRLVYFRAYVRDPGSREIGFILSLGPIAVLLFAGLAGVALAWMR
jgi:uncharacterized membrane protein YecN with MAPEG domain